MNRCRHGRRVTTGCLFPRNDPGWLEAAIAIGPGRPPPPPRHRHGQARARLHHPTPCWPVPCCHRGSHRPGNANAPVLQKFTALPGVQKFSTRAFSEILHPFCRLEICHSFSRPILAATRQRPAGTRQHVDACNQSTAAPSPLATLTSKPFTTETSGTRARRTSARRTKIQAPSLSAQR